MKTLLISLVVLLNSTALIAEDPKPNSAVKGLDHLGLTVKDLDRTANFFVEYLAFSIGGEDKSYPSFLIHKYIPKALTNNCQQWITSSFLNAKSTWKAIDC